MTDPQSDQRAQSEGDPSLVEKCNSAIWGAVMEGTAWCGWTDRAREGLVESVQSAVAFAINGHVREVKD